MGSIFLKVFHSRIYQYNLLMMYYNNPEYVNPNNTEMQSDTYTPGYTAIYVKDVKFPSDGDGPFQLVYVSPSFESDNSGAVTGAIIYKINKEYNPNQ